MVEIVAVEHLAAGYGNAVVLQDVSLSLEQGQSLALLGRNGMGKTTLLNSIVGVTRWRGGVIRLGGADITRTAVARPGPWDVKRVYAMFPRLAERRGNMGNQLSGGEQQMLAVGRALVLNPTLMLLDEPTEGLAPIIVQELMAALARIVRDEGLSMVIVEQHAQKVLAMTHRAVILENGAVVFAGSADVLRQDAALLERHLGVAGVERV
jgi:branched-chain amino acid transport system ATP-binding protein